MTRKTYFEIVEAIQARINASSTWIEIDCLWEWLAALEIAYRRDLFCRYV